MVKIMKRSNLSSKSSGKARTCIILGLDERDKLVEKQVVAFVGLEQEAVGIVCFCEMATSW